MTAKKKVKRLKPNKTTIKAMKAARRGGLPKFKTVKDLKAHLED